MMMKRLYLLRHAKSSWKHPELADHDRPLAGRGRRATAAIARHLDIDVDLVLCSTARRARETYEGIEAALGDADVRFEPGLYGASADELLERLRAVPEDVGAVMLIGHNPAMQELAIALAPGRDELREKFPTGALASFALDAGRSTLIDFVRPRDLEP